MDYEKKYKEIVGQIRKAYLYAQTDSTKAVLEEIIPELAESEDEKIRKWIVDDITFNMNNEPLNNSEYRKKAEKAIAWLEKQKEYESTDFEYVWDRTDCGELTAALDKYSEEAIINMCHAWYDKGIELERKSWLEKQGENPIKFNNSDIIDSDLNDYCCKIYNALHKENGGVLSFARLQHLAMDIYGWCNEYLQGEQKPADTVEPKFKVGDKIRRKTPSSFDKDMQVARIEKDYYVCNHIGKFSSEVVPFSKQSSYELIEQNPAWSEEEEAVLDALIRRLKGEDIHVSPHLAVECLKSIKDRVLPQPKQEWSEEDEHRIKDTVYFLETAKKHYASTEELDACIDWLKHLRPLKRWKPSDEQMGCLSDAIEYYNSLGYPAPKLKELLDDLKKIKEGKV